MAIERHHNVIHRHAQLFRGCTDNTQVRLMRHQPVECGALKAIRLQRFINNVGQFRHRDLKHFVTCHGQVDRAVRIHTVGIRQR